jgi:hypothetical protein
MKIRHRRYFYNFVLSLIAISGLLYYSQIPEQAKHWTLIIPWCLALYFFVAWRTKISIKGKLTNKLKVKRYK